MFGTITRHENFSSNFVQPRHIDVWLPPAARSATKTAVFPVLYMHDGQNLFYENQSYGGQTWGIDPALKKLQNKITLPIVVGIWNTNKRWEEYCPQRPFSMSETALLLEKFRHSIDAPPISDSYLSFLTQELKPFIDQTYPTRPEREATFIMGSSMGGLISLYALCEYPELFAGAGCLSTHWPAVANVMPTYLENMLPPAGSHKLYFDFGTLGLDAEYEPHQKTADRILTKKGYTPSQDWITQKFPGTDHSENAWRARVNQPLKFLLQK